MPNKTILCALAGVAMTLAAPVATAQAKAKQPAPAPVASTATPGGGIGAGDTELNFFGAFSDQDALGTSLALGVAFGSYLTDDVQLKVTQVMFLLDADTTSVFSYVPYVAAEYQIRPAPGSPFVAYVGGGAGLSLTTIDSGGFDFFTYSLFLTPVAGAKYFLDERMSLTYSLSYQFPLVEETCGDVDCVSSDTTTLQNFLGFSIYY